MRTEGTKPARPRSGNPERPARWQPQTGWSSADLAVSQDLLPASGPPFAGIRPHPRGTWETRDGVVLTQGAEFAATRPEEHCSKSTLPGLGVRRPGRGSCVHRAAAPKTHNQEVPAQLSGCDTRPSRARAPFCGKDGRDARTIISKAVLPSLCRRPHLARC
jgi:hypothetical protein